jgi:uncharacterized protein
VLITAAQAQRLYKDSDGVHDFDHVTRVHALATRIALSEGANLEVVSAAALLHDVGRSQAEALGLDHAEVAAQRARELLSEHPPEITAAVAGAILAHRFRSNTPPDTLEGQVLYDADKLDAIGAVGIARVFAYAGAHGQRIWAPLDGTASASNTSPADDPGGHTAVDEFLTKLSLLKDRLFTATGRALAQERQRYMAQFFLRFDAEVRGEK